MLPWCLYRSVLVTVSKCCLVDRLGGVPSFRPLIILLVPVPVPARYRSCRYCRTAVDGRTTPALVTNTDARVYVCHKAIIKSVKLELAIDKQSYSSTVGTGRKATSIKHQATLTTAWTTPDADHGLALV